MKYIYSVNVGHINKKYSIISNEWIHIPHYISNLLLEKIYMRVLKKKKTYRLSKP